MNKYVSVFSLFVRAALGKVLVLLGVLTVIETGVWIVATKFTELSFHATVEQALFLRIFQIVWYVLTYLLIFSLGRAGNKPGYTLRRLAVSEKAALYLQAGCNTLMLLVVAAWQLALCLGFAAWHYALSPESYNHQTLLLDFYKNPLLHTLLPLSDYMCWIANIVAGLLFGMFTARTSYLYRRGQRPTGLAIALMIPTELSMRTGDDSLDDMIFIIFGLITLGLCVYFQHGWKEATDDG